MVDYKALKEIGMTSGKFFYRCGQAIYFAPSFYKYLSEKFDDEPFLAISPTIFGSIFGNAILNLMTPFSIAEMMGEKPTLIYLGISLATNTASGLYEWYRYTANKNKPLSPTSKLEEKVEIPDVWNQDFDKIESSYIGGKNDGR